MSLPAAFQRPENSMPSLTNSGLSIFSNRFFSEMRVIFCVPPLLANLLEGATLTGPCRIALNPSGVFLIV